MISSRALKVAIITENFLPKVDGVTVTLAHLLEHLNAQRIETMLLGPESGMTEYAGCRLFGAFGFPLKFYPGLKMSFLPPSFIQALREFNPDVVHLVDPIWLGIQALVVVKLYFPGIPLVTSHDTNLPTYATIFGFPYSRQRGWQTSSYVHSLANFTLVPSPSTASLLRQKGYVNLRICDRGVNPLSFSPALRDSATRERWGLHSADLAVLSVGRLSPEKNLLLLIESFSLLSKETQARTVLIFVGDGPLAARLPQLCASKNVRAVFLGQLTGTALGEAFASADIMSSPSFTETFGQVTLEALASGLPVVGLYAEGTVDLVTHLRNGLLLDIHSVGDFNAPWNASVPAAPKTTVACYDSCADLMHPSSPSFGVIAARYALLLERLISDPALRGDMAAAALSCAQEYSWDRCMRRITEDILTLLRTVPWS
ncbi:glycosyl transferase group 1 [Mycena leptocephala]|nr:glycosyl transferase group 1 [Mycena leptocephala]